jgi:hypothetical protein
VRAANDDDDGALTLARLRFFVPAAVVQAAQMAAGNERRGAVLRDAADQCRASALQGVVQERLLRAQLQHVCAPPSLRCRSVLPDVLSS